jgi:lipoprotein-anchoring transpeptidase ErfK/SrfK
MQIVKLTVILMTGTVEAFSQESSRRLVISIPDRKIALIEDGRVTRMYPVAVGKPSTPSPAGTFQIVTRIPYPTWYGHGVVPPGPANPLGTRWIGLSQRGYGIHGTNKQSSVGKASSHGCIRMRKADVEELFQLVAIGDTVEMVETLPQDLAQIFHPAPVAPAISTAVGGGE